MSTDVEKIVSHSADKQLQDIEKKYPGFIHMKSQSGIKLSYKLQKILQAESSMGIVRGFRQCEGEFPDALNGFLYSILRNTKQQRRALVLSVLKQFDEQVKTSLSQMLYLSDNLAYFPYQVQDEPLFIIHHIDIMISVSGTNLVQSFREALLPGTNTNQEARLNPETGATEIVYVEEEDDDEDEDAMLGRVPDDVRGLQECITAYQGCLLLRVLKQHLKDLYGISDAQITQYSPSESAKVYENTINRHSNSHFDPEATLQKLRQGSPASILEARQLVTGEYLDMLLFAPTVPKLTIVPPRPPEVKDSRHHQSHKTHRPEQHEKHRHEKKKRKVTYSEDNDDEYSDP